MSQPQTKNVHGKKADRAGTDSFDSQNSAAENPKGQQSGKPMRSVKDQGSGGKNNNQDDVYDGE
jgi:hypothetical protein